MVHCYHYFINLTHPCDQRTEYGTEPATSKLVERATPVGAAAASSNAALPAPDALNRLPATEAQNPTSLQPPPQGAAKGGQLQQEGGPSSSSAPSSLAHHATVGLLFCRWGDEAAS